MDLIKTNNLPNAVILKTMALVLQDQDHMKMMIPMMTRAPSIIVSRAESVPEFETMFAGGFELQLFVRIIPNEDRSTIA
jgi:hypothetical protein